MTYPEARQFIENHDDPFCSSQIIAFHKTPCDDGTEEVLYMCKSSTGMINMWYAHSCGYQLWIRELPANKLPDTGWQLLQIACNRVIFDAIFPGKLFHNESQCLRHSNHRTGSECNA